MFCLFSELPFITKKQSVSFKIYIITFIATKIKINLIQMVLVFYFSAAGFVS